MDKYTILILLVTVCDGGIQINIETSNIAKKTVIEHKGSDIKQVTDKEIQLFNITNENLNRGVRVEMGKVPDELFLKDPTVYGNVFEKYKWPDVSRKLSVRNIKIVEFIKENVTLKRDVNINNTTETLQLKTDVAVTVTNTVAATWNDGGLPDDTISYNVSINFGYGKALHQSTWRNPNTTTFDLLIKKTRRARKVKSGHSIVKKLLAEKIILLVEIEMDAHLIGNIVASYAHTYGKYHLWAPTIGNIMRAGNLTNEITTTFLLEIRYYSNARLVLVDKNDTAQEETVEKKIVMIPRKKRTHKLVLVDMEKVKFHV